ncbi:MAG: type I polyketide synthase [Myxococcota bacterium]
MIRGSAINNDGLSNGLTAPNPRAQEDVLWRAYQRAGISSRDVDYVEAHGTGTILGDPIEAKALGAILGQGRQPEQKLRIGSVKTNIGHLEGAAGIAGLIKTCLAIWHRELPPSLHFDEPNPHIPFDQLGIQVVDARTPWPDKAERQVAGISSFGWGGTNAHIVLSEPPGSPITTLLMAADSEEELRQKVIGARAMVSEESLKLAEIQHRVHSEQDLAGGWRLAASARSHAELCEQLSGYLQGQSSPGLYTGRVLSETPGPIFVCSPQGSQWLGMGRRLTSSEPVFRHALTQCDRAFTEVAGWSLLDQMFAAESHARFDDCDVIQPCLVAVQIALAAQLRDWGIEPAMVVGHSIGEVSAAHIAGILDLKDTFLVAHHYSRLQKLTANQGGMAVVEMSASDLESSLSEFEQRIVIAGYNSQTSTVVSGDVAALHLLLDRIKVRGARCSMIKVNVAAHSPQMDRILDELQGHLQSLQPRSAQIPMMSTLTAEPISDGEIDATYFPRNLRQPVRFNQVIEQLLACGHNTYVELSPTPILGYAMEQSAARLGHQATVLGTLARGHVERLALH